jgi:hypothetical protein
METMAGYTGYWSEDEDYEGYRTTPDSYVPGSVAYNWLVCRVAPTMPVDSLMDAAECLDIIYDYVDKYQLDGFTLLVFKLLVIFDSELRSLAGEFIYLVKDYLLDDHPSVKVYCVELIYRYLQYRKPDKYL